MAKEKKVIEEEATIKEEKPKVEKETKEETKETVKPKQTDEKNEDEKGFTDKVKDAFNETDEKKFSKEEVESGKVMAILSYIGILCLIPWFVEKKNKYVHFHARQGLNLVHVEFIASIAAAIIGAVLTVVLWFLGAAITYLLEVVVSAGSIALSVVGIVYACQGKAKELPIVNKFKIVKK